MPLNSLQYTGQPSVIKDYPAQNVSVLSSPILGDRDTAVDKVDKISAFMKLILVRRNKPFKK